MPPTTTYGNDSPDMRNCLDIFSIAQSSRPMIRARDRRDAILLVLPIRSSCDPMKSCSMRPFTSNHSAKPLVFVSNQLNRIKGCSAWVMYIKREKREEREEREEAPLNELDGQH